MAAAIRCASISCTRQPFASSLMYLLNSSFARDLLLHARTSSCLHVTSSIFVAFTILTMNDPLYKCSQSQQYLVAGLIIEDRPIVVAHTSTRIVTFHVSFDPIEKGKVKVVLHHMHRRTLYPKVFFFGNSYISIIWCPRNPSTI